jgi:hypothetical protein
MAAAALVFVLLFIPETKGKTLEELEVMLMRKGKSAQAERPKPPGLAPEPK